jgi:NADPH:quinone reductase-like Zn-dependent oxidoreductase
MKEVADMKAITFSRFGSPDVLEFGEVPDPVPGHGEALVQVEAASINPSDVKNVAGAMSQTTLPRIPGRDFAGVVKAGPMRGSAPRSGAAAMPETRGTVATRSTSLFRSRACAAIPGR